MRGLHFLDRTPEMVSGLNLATYVGCSLSAEKIEGREETTRKPVMNQEGG